ncbi:spore coat protein GerQ, partial [Bacillus sp. MHSD17]|nr:spore coat protein GerQ [Bacillus sp. MHSD17]
MAQQQNPYYGTGFYQPSGTYVQPQQMTAGQQQQQQQAMQQQAAQAQYAISQGMLPLEQSYIENILRLNKGKQATIVMTYERGSSLGTQSYTGIIEAAGRDHIVISEPESGKRYLLQVGGPSGLRKTNVRSNSLAHRTTWL